MQPFHLAIPVIDLEKTRQFYRDVLGCSEGRTDSHWVDFDFFGHQLVLHQKPESEFSEQKTNSKSANPNLVDGKEVPVPHFGVVLEWEKWEELAQKLKAQNIKFVIEPYLRFEGKVGEQATMFFFDPENNALEFKAFKNIDQLFAK
jgi:hypothetical protein